MKDWSKLTKNNEEEAIRRALRKIFKAEGQQLELLRTSSLASTWKLHSANGVMYFIKAKQAGRNAHAFIANRWVSSEMAKMHTETADGVDNSHLGLWVCGAEPINVSRKGLTVLPRLTTKTIIIEIQRYYTGRTLTSMIKGARRTELNKDDKKLIDSICRAFEKIHRRLPEMDADINDPVIQKRVYDDELRKLHYESLSDVYQRIDVYVPSNITHPIISPQEKLLIIGYCEEVKTRWSNRGDRLCALHGDPRTENIIFLDSTGEPKFIDFSRTMWGTRGYDCGRFVMELIELYYTTKNPYYKEFANYFVDSYTELIHDKELREEMCLGIISMTLIKLYPLGTPIEDIDVQRKVYAKALEILAAGKFTF